MRRFAAIVLFLQYPFSIILAQPVLQWQKALGGSSDDYAYEIQQTADKGYVITGNSWSLNGDVTYNHGDFDMWTAKVDSSGNIQWQRSLGGSTEENSYSVAQTADGGYIVGGNTWSNNGNVTGNHGCSDFWVVKLDSAGNLQWQKALGGTDEECIYSVRQTADGGYIMTGYTLSVNGDVTSSHGGNDYWVVRLGVSGSILWQKTFGGSADDYPYSIEQTSDGGYIAAGHTWSNNGNVTGNHGGCDFWVVRMDSTGNLLWQKALGGSGEDYARSIAQTADGGYIVAGFSFSDNGDVSGNHGGDDYWVAKLDTSGNLQWQTSLGGSLNDRAFSVVQTSTGQYMVSGYSMSNDGDVTGNHGLNDFWVVLLSDTGSIVWQKTLGGTGGDGAYSGRQTSDGGFVVAGQITSNNGDITGNHGACDYWIAKLYDITTAMAEGCGPGDKVVAYPNPSANTIRILTKQDLAGSDYSILDMSGKTIKKGIITGEHTDVDISGLPAGIYIYSTGRKEAGTIKIIKW